MTGDCTSPTAAALRAETTRARRERLRTVPNPDPAHDYVSALQAMVETETLGAVRVSIRYVPDRAVLPPDGLTDYLPAIAGLEAATLEHLALTAIEDLNDALIPRWVEVDARMHSDDGTGGHAVCVEDRQPGWDNPRLLARLATL